MNGFGFPVTVEKKEKKPETNIASAFIKAGTLKNMIVIDIPQSLKNKIHREKTIKVNLEVDKEPPGDFCIEAKYLFQPLPFSVNTYTLPYLFAGKMHAILCRPWVNRVKGRDWYDLVWYAGRDISVNLKHLENRMKQTGHLKASESLTEKVLKQKLQERIESIDFEDAKKDVENLLKDPSSLEVWSGEFFKVICGKVKVEGDI
ncbi:nucleotidyl transferase AbiEii/AbiGii toxin family protein [Candidatus Desantisbacteria bacterium]|nr:nucleotidyl transferase AbiEii/AbiGii toxin family protein [Candidatus Desantisbacteria bacterium]